MLKKLLLTEEEDVAAVWVVQLGCCVHDVLVGVRLKLGVLGLQIINSTEVEKQRAGHTNIENSRVIYYNPDQAW
jgi:hypothetical protein